MTNALSRRSWPDSCSGAVGASGADKCATSGIVALLRASGSIKRWKRIFALWCAGPNARRLLDGSGELRNAWKIARGKRTWSTRYLYDVRSSTRVKVGVLALPLVHPEHARPLFLVVARSKRGREPWYLLTSDVICSAEDAWA